MHWRLVMIDWSDFDTLYNDIVTRMIKDGYIVRQWTPEERQAWLDKMVNTP